MVSPLAASFRKAGASHLVRTFFDTYLKGASVSGLTTSSPLYREVQILQ